MKRHRSWMRVALLGLAACGGVDMPPDPGGRACTEMGCTDGLDIAFVLTEPGNYTFGIVADGEVITCTAALPLAACPQGSSPASCSSASVTLAESGCALPAAEQSLGGISFLGGHPASVEITVKQDGAEIARQTLAPVYERVAPNGEECGPICSQATVGMQVGP